MNASSAAGTLKQDLSDFTEAELAAILAEWPLWARDDQLPPEATQHGEAWRVWLVMGGRGAGKTRVGAEWVRAKALGLTPLGEVAACRIALVGETIAEVRRVMIEGVSGLLSVHGTTERPRFEPSKFQLVWPSGAIAQMFSAENPDALRGPQFDAAWSDEIAKWRRPQRAWDMLQFALRLGRRPQMVVTTTPRPMPLLKKLIADAATVVTRFKETNDERLDALERRSAADPLIEEKLTRIDRALDEHRRTVDDLALKAARPPLGGTAPRTGVALAHKAAFDGYVRKGEPGRLRDLESKALAPR